MQDPIVVYQVKIMLRGVSPTIWRRLLIRSDSTIAQLHYIIQIVMGWSNIHLNQFTIRGKQYGVSYAGGIDFSDDPKQVRLDSFRFRLRERFVYEYNFYDNWYHDIRIENIYPLDNDTVYPVCISGKRSAPPEDCGNAWSFMALKDHYSPAYITYRILELLKENNLEKLDTLKYWLQADRFKRKEINKRLYQYIHDHTDPQMLIEEVEQWI